MLVTAAPAAADPGAAAFAEAAKTTAKARSLPRRWSLIAESGVDLGFGGGNN